MKMQDAHIQTYAKLTCVELGDMMHIWEQSTGPHSATGQLLRYCLTYIFKIQTTLVDTYDTRMAIQNRVPVLIK